MIYLIDQPLTETSHSRYMLDIIREHTSVGVSLEEINQSTLMRDLYRLFDRLFYKVKPIDIILCPWCIPASDALDAVIMDLTMITTVVAAAGNFSEPLENISPARAEGVITVGTLNKLGLKAALSNYSDTKEIIWVPGTNYSVGWKNGSGTSVSAALYSAWLAESRDKRDPRLLDRLMREHSDKVFAELNQA